MFSKIRTPDKIIEPDTPEISPFNIEPPEINVPEQQIEITEPEPIELNPPKIIEPDTPEISPFNIEPPKINVPEQQIKIAEPEPIELNPPKIIEPDTPEISPFNIEPPEINVPEQQIEITEPEPIELNPPKFIEPDTPEISPFNIEPPKINVPEQQIEIAEPEPIELNPPKFIEPDTPEISPFNIEPPEINVPEQSEIELNAPEIITDSEPETFDFDISKNNTFTQQIELLREFSPENNIPQIADDERITEEIQSQLDEISVTLNADSFISQFQNILSNIGVSSVPQYSPIYAQTQNMQKNHENSKLELPQNSNQSVPQKLSIFIGDREIRDFIISAINEENAMSGGASF